MHVSKSIITQKLQEFDKKYLNLMLFIENARHHSIPYVQLPQLKVNFCTVYIITRQPMYVYNIALRCVHATPAAVNIQ
jgi:hypothetical protein